MALMKRLCSLFKGLLRRWAEAENFHTYQLLRAERIITSGVDNGRCDYLTLCAKGAASCIDGLRGLFNADKRRNIHSVSSSLASNFIINQAGVLPIPFPGRV